MHPHSLDLIEFPRVAAALAARATSPRASAALLAAAPRRNAADRALACARLDEAIRRQREPGAWCFAAPSALADVLAGDAHAAFEPEAFAIVGDWLEANARTRGAWTDAPGEPSRRLDPERFPRLADLVRELPDLADLAQRIAATIDADGNVRDSASPRLARARKSVLEGERSIHRQLERWTAGRGTRLQGGSAESYVTRAGDRFVALVPAAGFSRRLGIVHDSSNSGQSLFVEPFDVCEANNRLIELRAEALEEERRILRELAAAVRAQAPALETVERTLAVLDALRACAVWSAELSGIAITPGGDELKLVHARHPLLAMQHAKRETAISNATAAAPTAPGNVNATAAAGGREGSNVIPLDLELGTGGRILLVSGPNMGGKTVLLKTVGLAVALAHAGLPVLAAEGSMVPVLEDLYADLGDEQSVDHGLSTFAAHLLALKAMAEAAGPGALLLADELGAGTDPEEGAALGRALIEHAAVRGAWGVFTTHLGSLKRVAGSVPGVVNGSLEFDLETLTSRYRFRRGVPGASHALDVAGRLGFPESVLARARALTPDETRALERLLAEVGDALAAAHAERAALAHARAEAEEAAARHREAREESLRSLAGLRRGLTAESEVLLARARELWQSVQRAAKRSEKSRADADVIRDAIGSLEHSTSALDAKASPAALGLPESAPAPPALTPGARVRVTDLGFEATLVSGPDADGRVQLRRGSFTIQSHVDRLAAAAPAAGPTVRGPSARYESSDEPPPLEADLRGLEVADALVEVDRALDRAVMAGLTEIRLIHGIGTGALRTAVQKHLKSHPQVESQRWGEGHEGGRGVTVARLR